VILAAGLLVLIGLALFVAGIATSMTVLYWLCVASCVAAGVLLFLARRRMTATTPAPGASAGGGPEPGQEPGPEAGLEAGQAAGPPARPTGGDARTATTAPASGTPDTTTADDERVPSTAAEDGRGDVTDGGDERPATDRPPAEDAAPTSAAPTSAAPTSAAPDTNEAPEAPASRHGHRSAPVGDGHTGGEPPLEDVEVTDLLLVLDLRDEVLVVDEHPRYHLAGCRWLRDREPIPLPIDEARTDGFTPCGTCAPDRHLADVERGRRTGRSS
jgi:hypothetical protein